MQTLLDQLPGININPGKGFNINPGFAIIDRRVNSLKGWMFDEDLSSTRLKDDFDSPLDQVRNFIILFRIFKDKELKRIFNVTNNRVYSTFIGIDQAIQAESMKRRVGTPLPHDWAAQYKI